MHLKPTASSKPHSSDSWYKFSELGTKAARGFNS